MKRLTKEQQQTLVDVLIERSGSRLGFDEFTNRMLILFEDVPGFETISRSESRHVINQLWRIYNGTQRN